MAPPSWRPDGRELAFVAAGDQKLIYYSTHHLAVVSADGGAPRILTRLLDRNVMSPVRASNGRAIYFLVEDDGNQHLARIETGSNSIERIVDGRRETTSFDVGGKDASRCSMASSKRPRRCTRSTSVATAASRVTTTNGSRREARRHGGDFVRLQGRHAHQRLHRQAARLPPGAPLSDTLVDPRRPGLAIRQFVLDAVADLRVERLCRARRQSARQLGRGEKFATAIYADWGNKDTEDVLGAVDYAVKQGIADPDRLGVGGWSYGGILTNFVISKDTRFKSATSGASISNVLAGYGTDMYVREYEAELGTPWKNLDVWLHNVSVPARRPHQDADAVPVRRRRFQRAAAELRADVPGAAQPGRRDAAGDLSGPVPRPDQAELSARAHAALLDWHGKYLANRARKSRRADFPRDVPVTAACRPALPSSRSRPARAHGCPRADRA